MNLLKLYFLFVLLLTANFVLGKVYLKGSITYLNGDIKTGYLLIPEMPKQKIIKFKLSRNISKEEKIQSEDIKSVSVESEDGNSYVFERIPTAKKPGKKPNRPCWLLVSTSGYSTLYITASYYQTDKKGNVSVVIDTRISFDLGFKYFLRKGNQDIAYRFGTTHLSIVPSYSFNKELIKNSELFLSDYPELVERIKNKEFKHVDIKAIIQIYNDYMKDSKPIQHL